MGRNGDYKGQQETSGADGYIHYCVAVSITDAILGPCSSSCPSSDLALGCTVVHCTVL